MQRPTHLRARAPAALLLAALGLLPAAAGGIGPGPGPRQDAPASAAEKLTAIFAPLPEEPPAADPSPAGRIRVLEPLPVNEQLKRTVLDDRLFAASAPPATVPAPPMTEPPAPPMAEPPGVDGVFEMVESWAEAWSSQDVERYLSFYSREFAPPGGASRQAWDNDRRQKITAPGSIEVEISSLQGPVSPSPGKLRLSFRQAYDSDFYSDVVHKTLELVREDGGWKIVHEEAEDWP